MIVRSSPMHINYWGTLAVIVCLAGCTREDDAAARKKLENAKQELKQETHDAARKVQQGLHEAGQELKRDAHDASEKIKKSSQKLKDDLRSK